jgi:hypothetical protein
MHGDFTKANVDPLYGVRSSRYRDLPGAGLVEKTEIKLIILLSGRSLHGGLNNHNILPKIPEFVITSIANNF